MWGSVSCRSKWNFKEEVKGKRAYISVFPYKMKKIREVMSVISQLSVNPVDISIKTAIKTQNRGETRGFVDRTIEC